MLTADNPDAQLHWNAGAYETMLLYSHADYPNFPLNLNAGACGITAATLYNVYLVAQDFISPPNLQATPRQRPLNTSDTTGGFTCTAGIFTSHLKPDIVPVGASPGLPVSPLYGNVTASTR